MAGCFAMILVGNLIMILLPSHSPVYFRRRTIMPGTNANIDYCGICNLLRLLESQGFSKVELKKIAARIAADIGADIIFC